MRGSFTSGRYRFLVEGIGCECDLARGFHEYLEDDDFDLRLTSSGKVPDLGGAPIASWLLARLARLMDNRLGLAGLEDIDGGGYVVRFFVYIESKKRKENPQQLFLFDKNDLDFYGEPETAIAAFQFQADMEGAAVLGRKTPDYPAEELLEAFAAALLAATADLMSRELAVWDPEWKLDPEMYSPRPTKGSRNWYGWDGFQFLGADNIRGTV